MPRRWPVEVWKLRSLFCFFSSLLSLLLPYPKDTKRAHLLPYRHQSRPALAEGRGEGSRMYEWSPPFHHTFFSPLFCRANSE